MALRFPLSLEDFFDTLPIRSQVFELSEALETSETGGGEIIVADYGPRLWQGSVSLIRQQHHMQQQASAKIDMLREAGASFLIHDLAVPGPFHDPEGAIVATHTPTLHSVATNNKEVRLGGLPRGYRISPGDRLSFTHANNPVRYALHKIVSAGTMGSTATNWIEVRPHVRPGAQSGARVRLHKPVCKAVLMPNSFRAGTRERDKTGGISFGWRQTLR